MNASETLQLLSNRIQARFPILFLRSYEEIRWEKLLENLAQKMERTLVCWSTASPGQSSSLPSESSVLEFLTSLKNVTSPTLFLIKDLHPYLTNALIIRQIRELIPTLQQRQQTILVFSPVEVVPIELFKDSTVVDLPNPNSQELSEVLQETLNELKPDGSYQLTPRQHERLTQAVIGLTEAEARRAFSMVLQGSEKFTDEVFPQLVKEKRHLIQGAGLLEFFDIDESADDIGGLENLKEWVIQRSEGFSTQAKSFGVSFPRGVLLTGVQGCGKSLSARVIARVFGFPLIRMDFGALLEGERGASEQNLRDVLSLLESVSPCVLWLEEIDKALASFQEAAKNDGTVSRLVGRFLTWMQEHTAPVFIVATANNVQRLPPELLRRGRFDELFFVDLPNFYERKEIFKIHLVKRGWNSSHFNLDDLAERSDGYSGAEIEEIVNSCVIEAHALKNTPNQAKVLEAIDAMVPLSVTMEDEIFQLREWARTRCRQATLEQRVMTVIDEENRKGEVIQYHHYKTARWVELAQLGQIGAALHDYVELHDHVQWKQLINDFQQYFPSRGEYGLVLKSHRKVVVAVRISKEIADLISEYIQGRRLYLHLDQVENIPEADRPLLHPVQTIPLEEVSKPVWLPTKFRIVPDPVGNPALNRLLRIRMGGS